ncbi:hypothetical protein [Paenibacillus aquistagni]|uniref:Uncharacterized protein n=1 Tax=Paenibacillus aquistagni TaxID=1852522 RepID=A0A1X7L9L6_9BACL|nr:hypothetical protein [Paenibacillus aquistagni]SMG50511.1 hypothetical protein SAMN06295960_3129 [Paenibacillus aquistagni]
MLYDEAIQTRPLFIMYMEQSQELHETDDELLHAEREQKFRKWLLQQDRKHLLMLKTISLVGQHERGYYYEWNEGETIEHIIKIEITRSHEQLLHYYSKYLVYDKKEAITSFLLHERNYHAFKEGLCILEILE